MLLLILICDTDEKRFPVSFYPSRLLLLPFLVSCVGQLLSGQAPWPEFSGKEAKLTFIPLQKAFLGARVRGTCRDVRYRGSHPNVKTSLHIVLSSLSNKLQFLAHETGGMGEWWGRKEKSRRVTYCPVLRKRHPHAVVQKISKLHCTQEELL